MSKVKLEHFDKFNRTKQVFGGNDKYKGRLARAYESLCEGNVTAFEHHLAQLPNEQQLLQELCEKLKDKPVYKNLKRINDGTAKNIYMEMKGWGSLLTHIVIEMEKGNMEYSLLLGTLYEKLGSLMYRSLQEQESS